MGELNPEKVPNMRVVDIKKQLKKRGLPINGLKAEVVKRLVEVLNDEQKNQDKENEKPQENVETPKAKLPVSKGKPKAGQKQKTKLLKIEDLPEEEESGEVSDSDEISASNKEEEEAPIIQEEKTDEKIEEPQHENSDRTLVDQEIQRLTQLLEQREQELNEKKIKISDQKLQIEIERKQKETQENKLILLKEDAQNMEELSIKEQNLLERESKIDEKETSLLILEQNINLKQKKLEKQELEETERLKIEKDEIEQKSEQIIIREIELENTEKEIELQKYILEQKQKEQEESISHVSESESESEAEYQRAQLSSQDEEKNHFELCLFRPLQILCFQVLPRKTINFAGLQILSSYTFYLVDRLIESTGNSFTAERLCRSITEVYGPDLGTFALLDSKSSMKQFEDNNTISLTLPVDVIKNIAFKQADHVEENALYGLTAAVEFIIAEIMELSGANDDVSVITPDLILDAVKNDVEHSRLLFPCKTTFTKEQDIALNQWKETTSDLLHILRKIPVSEIDSCLQDLESDLTQVQLNIRAKNNITAFQIWCSQFGSEIMETIRLLSKRVNIETDSCHSKSSNGGYCYSKNSVFTIDSENSKEDKVAFYYSSTMENDVKEIEMRLEGSTTGILWGNDYGGDFTLNSETMKNLKSTLNLSNLSDYIMVHFLLTICESEQNVENCLLDLQEDGLISNDEVGVQKQDL